MIRMLLATLLLASISVAQEKSCLWVGTKDGMGSGTVVAKDGNTCYILTNRHVIDGTKTVWVMHGGKRVQGTFVKKHTAVDLALVSAEIDAEPVKLADSEPQEGDELRHYGRATGMDGPQTGKMVGWTQFATSDGWVLNSDFFSIPGDSGAGVFNKEGKLVAVHYGRMGNPDSVTKAIAVRLPNVREFVKAYLK